MPSPSAATVNRYPGRTQTPGGTPGPTRDAAPGSETSAELTAGPAFGCLAG